MFKIVLLAVAAAGAVPAVAHPPHHPHAVAPERSQRVDVDYRDLDLGSAHDLAVLDRRINQAVRQVCGRWRIAQAQTVINCRGAARDLAATQRTEILANAGSSPGTTRTAAMR
jgi:UrcA family protein